GRMRARERSEALLLTLLFGVRRARAARFARALIRRCAPPSPAAQEKGWIHWRGKAWRRKPFSRSREKVPGEPAPAKAGADEDARAKRSVPFRPEPRDAYSPTPASSGTSCARSQATTASRSARACADSEAS